ncbi:hypothetical protein N9S00_08090 [Luminiphilus sp.]|nr:hypothetical protein [Luminiphilus sp.]
MTESESTKGKLSVWRQQPVRDEHRKDKRQRHNLLVGIAYEVIHSAEGLPDPDTIKFEINERIKASPDLRALGVPMGEVMTVSKYVYDRIKERLRDHG